MKMNRERIVLFGDPVLREIAKPVNVYHNKLHQLIDAMQFTLSCREDGAALAANQIGVLKRITVIDYQNEYFEMVNPEILDYSGENTDYEGCLSYPGYFGLVPRFETVTVKYFDRNGIEHIIERNDKMARCMQHEIDHLNGILFVDRMREGILTHSESKETIEVAKVIELTNAVNPR